MCRKSTTAHYRRVVWRCLANFPLPAAPMQCGCVMPHSHCLPPFGCLLRCRKSSAAHWREVVRQCIAGAPLPTAFRLCSKVMQEFHLLFPPAIWQCATTVPLLTIPKRCNGLLHEFHRPLPRGSGAFCPDGSPTHGPRGSSLRLSVTEPLQLQLWLVEKERTA